MVILLGLGTSIPFKVCFWSCFGLYWRRNRRKVLLLLLRRCSVNGYGVKNRTMYLKTLCFICVEERLDHILAKECNIIFSSNVPILYIEKQLQDMSILKNVEVSRLNFPTHCKNGCSIEKNLIRHLSIKRAYPHFLHFRDNWVLKFQLMW